MVVESDNKQAEKLKNREMKEEWIKNDQGWRMNDDDFKLLRGFRDWLTVAFVTEKDQKDQKIVQYCSWNLHLRWWKYFTNRNTLLNTASIYIFCFFTTRKIATKDKILKVGLIDYLN